MVVDPAYAGMIPYQVTAAELRQCGPRVCGDDPLADPTDEQIERWTPRMRG